jgi:hypothetical protein
MMKQLLLLLTFSLAANLLPAQDVVLSLSPNPSEANDIINMNDPNFELVAYATLTNVSSSPVSVRWTRIMPTLPMGWEVLVCDNVSCYPPFVSSNVMPEFDLNELVVLAPGGTTNLDVHVLPHQFAGSTTVNIQFTIGTDTTVVHTGTYNFNASLTSSANNGFGKQDIRVFPNPTIDYFQLSTGSQVSRVAVYNTLGRQVRLFDAVEGKRYSLAGLPDGMYMVSLLDSRYRNIKTVRMIKRGFRP